MGPSKFQKRPVVVSAIQYTGDNWQEILELIGDSGSYEDGRLLIHTLEGAMVADPGDYIIRGVKGEHYPCKPDIFEATYEDASGYRVELGDCVFTQKQWEVIEQFARGAVPASVEREEVEDDSHEEPGAAGDELSVQPGDD